MISTEWSTWIESEDGRYCKIRLEAGEEGAKYNPWLACEMAFNGGVLAGIEIASKRLERIIKKP